MMIPLRAAAVAATAVLIPTLVAGTAAAALDASGFGSAAAFHATAAGPVEPELVASGGSPAAFTAAAPAAKGDCFRLTVRQRNLGVLPKKAVDCAQSHDLEVAKVYRLPKKIAKNDMGAPAVYAWASTKCQVYGVPGYRGSGQVTLDFMGVTVLPTAKLWRAGQRWAVCAGASFDSRLQAQRSVGSIKQLAEPRAFCIKKTGGLSDCVPGTIRWTNTFQIYPNAWDAKYPGKKALSKQMRAKAVTYVERGQSYYVSLPVSKADWEDGLGRWAFVGVAS